MAKTTTIELKQFVKDALLGIIEGVDDANSNHNRFRIIGEKRNDSGVDGNMVEFDISIVAERESKSGTGGKVGTPILSVISANADLKLEQTNSRQNVNRLKFKVWISESELS